MKHSIRKALLLAGFCLLGALSAAAQPFLRLPAIIGDHMVLQEKTTVRLHGWADPNATLTVTPSWGEAVTIKVGYDTAWSVELTTPAASAEPRSITFATNKKAVRKVDDILIGQVWLCSGQSNMNWSAANGIVDMKKELESPMNPRIRHEKQHPVSAGRLRRPLAGVHPQKRPLFQRRRLFLRQTPRR